MRKLCIVLGILLVLTAGNLYQSNHALAELRSAQMTSFTLDLSSVPGADWKRYGIRIAHPESMIGGESSEAHSSGCEVSWVTYRPERIQIERDDKTIREVLVRPGEHRTQKPEP